MTGRLLRKTNPPLGRTNRELSRDIQSVSLSRLVPNRNEVYRSLMYGPLACPLRFGDGSGARRACFRFAEMEALKVTLTKRYSPVRVVEIRAFSRLTMPSGTASSAG
jgi:hypothetical protein